MKKFEILLKYNHKESTKTQHDNHTTVQIVSIRHAAFPSIVATLLLNRNQKHCNNPTLEVYIHNEKPLLKTQVEPICPYFAKLSSICSPEYAPSHGIGDAISPLAH